MGGCKSKTKDGTSNNSNKLTLAILGLDNAGKTVATKGLQGESLDTVAPTIGFSSVDFKFEKQDITLFDLGGGKRIRDIWKNYFADIYGLIYVIDSSEPERMDECHSVLSGLLEHPKISGKPVLVLANKQDKPGAMDEIDVCEYLRLEELVNRNKCPCRVETCSAILGQGKKLDKPIIQGMKWLLTIIKSNMEQYKERVERDSQEQRDRQQQEKKERAERIAKKREERKRQEEEEAAARGEVRKDTDDEEDVVDAGNPYQRLDYDQLKKKDEQLKLEKKRQKELKNNRHTILDEDSEEDSVGRPRLKKVTNSDDEEEIPSQSAIRSNRTNLGYDSDNDRLRLRKSGSLEPLGRSPVMPRRTLDLESASASLQKRRGLSSRTYGSDKENSDDDILSNNLQPPWMKGSHRSPRPIESSLGMPPVRNYGEENGDSQLHPPRRSLAPLTPLAHLEPLDSDAKKKKKKKPKKNQTLPVLDDDEDDYRPGVKSFYGGGLDPIPSRTGTPPQSRSSMLKASRSPRLATLAEPEEQESDFRSKWGLVDDLPDMPPSYSRKSRPNVDSDDDIIT